MATAETSAKKWTTKTSWAAKSTRTHTLTAPIFDVRALSTRCPPHLIHLPVSYQEAGSSASATRSHFTDGDAANGGLGLTQGAILACRRIPMEAGYEPKSAAYVAPHAASVCKEPRGSHETPGR